jgi:hypothetical protein
MRQVNNLQDVQVVLKEVFDFMDSFRTRDFILKGRRIRGAAPSEKDDDYVIRKELYNLPKQDLSGLKNDIRHLEAEIAALKTRVTCLELKVVDIYNVQIDKIWEALGALHDAFESIHYTEGETTPSVIIPEKPDVYVCTE